MKKALVTGANGFIGTEVCIELCKQGIEVIAVVRNETRNISRINALPGLRIVYSDMTEYNDLSRIVPDRDIDVMYHFAWEGCSGTARANSNVQIDNIRFSCTAIRACNEIGCRRFVFAASIMEYETEALMQTDRTPSVNSHYGIAKMSADYMARTIAGELGITYVRAVISNIYGPGENSPRLINTSIRKLLKGEYCQFSAGEQLYDFIYITDAAKMFARLGEDGKNNKTYYIGNDPRPLKEYILKMQSIVAPDNEIGLGKLPFDGVSLSYSEFNRDAVYNDTGIRPEVSFEEGIRKTMDWIKTESER